MDAASRIPCLMVLSCSLWVSLLLMPRRILLTPASVSEASFWMLVSSSSLVSI